MRNQSDTNVNTASAKRSPPGGSGRTRKCRRAYRIDESAVARRLKRIGFEVLGSRKLLSGVQYLVFGKVFVIVYYNGTVQAQGALSEKEKLKIKAALSR